MLIDYDRTAADYEASLVTKLRGHGVGSFLENWVPDPDPVLGIFNMIEAAWTDGREQLELVVARKTLDAAGLERLKALAAAIAEIVIAPSGEQHRLEVRRATGRANAGPRQTPSTTRAKTSSARQLETPARKKATPDLEPVLAEALKAETASFTHEGGANAVGISLTVGDDAIIRRARHAQVKPDTRRRLVELMCREIEGRTVQDASDHAAVLVVHRLRQRAESRPAAGILLPANAGTEVVAALEMLRGACHKYQEQSGQQRKANFFERAPSAQWQGLAAAEKLRQAAERVAEFCRTEGKAPSAARVAHVEKDIHGHEIRVIIQVDGSLAGEGVPLFLRRLERYLKGKLDETIQVYLEPLKDKNVLRRL